VKQSLKIFRKILCLMISFVKLWTLNEYFHLENLEWTSKEFYIPEKFKISNQIQIYEKTSQVFDIQLNNNVRIYILLIF
jgi:hypothetical protein